MLPRRGFTVLMQAAKPCSMRFCKWKYMSLAELTLFTPAACLAWWSATLPRREGECIGF